MAGRVAFDARPGDDGWLWVWLERDRKESGGWSMVRTQGEALSCAFRDVSAGRCRGSPPDFDRRGAVPHIMEVLADGMLGLALRLGRTVDK